MAALLLQLPLLAQVRPYLFLLRLSMLTHLRVNPLRLRMLTRLRVNPLPPPFLPLRPPQLPLSMPATKLSALLRRRLPLPPLTLAAPTCVCLAPLLLDVQKFASLALFDPRAHPFPLL